PSDAAFAGGRRSGALARPVDRRGIDDAQFYAAATHQPRIESGEPPDAALGSAGGEIRHGGKTPGILQRTARTRQRIARRTGGRRYMEAAAGRWRPMGIPDGRRLSGSSGAADARGQLLRNHPELLPRDGHSDPDGA